MARLNEQDFRKALSSGNISNVYLIYGEEKYLVREYTKRLCDKVAGKEPSDFDYLRFGSSAPLEDIFFACDQFPLFSKYKCVVVSDYDVNSLSDNDLKLLTKNCEDIASSAVLIFTMPTLSYEGGKNDKKSAKLQKLASSLQKCGTVLELTRRDDLALEAQLAAWAEKEGCALTKLNASRIISLCGTDMNALRNEMDKLIAYADGREITREMIGMLVVKNTEARIFALSDCISNGDHSGAYSQLYALFEQNEKPEIILSVLGTVYIDMYRAKTASESGKSISEAASDFKYGKREFLLKNAGKRAARFSTAALRNILDIILETDIRMKSKPDDRRILLETLIARLIVATNAKNSVRT